jgi:type IV pilus assembly protein PilC
MVPRHRDYGLIARRTAGGLRSAHSFTSGARTRWQSRDRWQLRLPILGALLRPLARWSHTLAGLYAAGIPLLDALVPAGNATSNGVSSRPAKSCTNSSPGRRHVASTPTADGISSLIGAMVAIGEESGALDDMLNKVANSMSVRSTTPSPNSAP